MIAIILSFFGYYKIPREAVKLAWWIENEAISKSPDVGRIALAANKLQKLFRSGDPKLTTSEEE